MSQNVTSFTNGKNEDDFAETNFKILAQKKYFVDKTLLIKEIFKERKHQLESIIPFNLNTSITTPHGFGKTTNLSMLKTFLEIQTTETGKIKHYKNSNYNIFKENNLNIYSDQELFKTHFGQYPVIYVSFKSVNGNNYMEFLNKFRLILQNTYRQFPYLLESRKLSLSKKLDFKKYSNYENKYEKMSEIDIGKGFNIVSKLLYGHFDKRKVFLLIDDYEIPVVNAKLRLDKDCFQNICEIMSHFLDNSGSEYITYRILSGTNYLKLFNSLEVKNYEFLSNHNYVPYYGLTQVELELLLQKYQIDKTTRDQVNSFYESYVSKTGIKLFSYLSIFNYLKKKELKYCWPPFDLRTQIPNLINVCQIRNCLERLCSDKFLINDIRFCITFTDYLIKIQEKRIYLNAFEFICLILQEGYLTYNGHIHFSPDISTYELFTNGIRTYGLKFVHKEILHEIKSSLNEYYLSKYNYPSINFDLNRCSEIFEQTFVNDTLNKQELENFVNEFNQLLQKLNLEKNLKNYYDFLKNICAKTQFSVDLLKITEIKAEDDEVMILSKDYFKVFIKLEFKSTPRRALKAIIGKVGLTKMKNAIFIGININSEQKTAVNILIKDNDLKILINL